MKHIFPIISIIFGLILLFFIHSNNITSAATANSLLTRPFGGKIVDNPAIEINTLELSGYKCAVPGTSITILPVSSRYPTSYLIPAGVISKSKNLVSAGEYILGLYLPVKTTIVCILPSDPPLFAYVYLNPITLFGTSMK